MTHARWKLLAGFFGLSMCGLAALASASGTRNVALGCAYRPDLESREVAQVMPLQPPVPKVERVEFVTPLPPPIVIPAPTPPAAPRPMLPAVAAELSLAPAVPAAPATQPQTLDLPLPAPALQKPSQPDAKFDLPPVPDTKSQTSTPLLPVLSPVTPQPTGLTSPVPGATPWTIPVIGEPVATLPTNPTTPERKPSVKAPAIPTIDATKPWTAPTPVAPSVPEIEIIVRMTGTTPSLSLRSSNGSFLNVKCDQLEIAARGPKDELPPSIRATGKVTFSASGCEGQCDELVFNPKAMDGTLKNAVRVKCSNQGTVTEFTAVQVAIQLKPGQESTLVPASGQTERRK